MTSYRFNFGLKLSIAFNSFFAKYQSFLTILANVSGVDANNITMINIVEGSTVLNGSVSVVPDNTTAASVIYTNMENNLRNGSVLGGEFTIIEAPVIEASNGTAPPLIDNGPNLTLILAIVIPIGVLCKFVLIFSDYRNRHFNIL